MTANHIYLSTTIPYVNGVPHLGHALEFVQADVLARHHRQIGDRVRFQTGTDDNSLKNVLAAQALGISTECLVARNAAAFAALQRHLELSADDFISTSSDPRHRPGVERLWRTCAARGDFYRKQYTGLYCTGCEQFYAESELTGGQCPEHGTAPQVVRETNWFFRLSRYSARLHDLVSSGELRIRPAGHRNAVLRFIDSGLADFSVSRPASRARGWGIGVPGDPEQVIYVWWDALANYLTALNYARAGEDCAGGDCAGGDCAGGGCAGADYQRWWAGADRRIHLAGKGVVRFHAVYWPAILLSAGLPLPTDIYVHDYLTAGGQRISKSGQAAGPAEGTGQADGAGRAVCTDPAVLASRYGSDAVRWWLLREVPRAGDADFTTERLIARANSELAGVIGNLVSRVAALVHSYRDGVVPEPPLAGRPTAQRLDEAGPELLAALPQPDAAADLLTACASAPAQIGAALARYDFRSATQHVVAIAQAANRYAERTEPWHLARAALAGGGAAGGEPAAAQFDAVLWLLSAACQAIGSALEVFVPGLAGRIRVAGGTASGQASAPVPVFPRIS